MKRLPIALMTLSIANIPVASEAADLYVEGFLGLTFLEEAEYDTDVINGINFDSDIDYKVGGHVGAALGTALPVDIHTVRLEGEIAYRRNEVDEVTDVDGDNFDGIDDSTVTALSGMANLHFDYFLTPSLALSAGGGVGLARVNADITIDNAGVDLTIIDDESDTVLAYQLMGGIRYNVGLSSAITAGYRYFATDDPEYEVGFSGSNDFESEYASHNITIGYAFSF